MKKCLKCGAENQDDPQQCVTCKSPLTKSIPPEIPAGTINLGDSGMIKESSFSVNTNVDSHNVTGGPAIGGSLHINLGGNRDDARITKVGEQCPICGILIEANYFQCSRCGKNYICREHQHKETFYCTRCMDELKKTEELKSREEQLRAEAQEAERKRHEEERRRRDVEQRAAELEQKAKEAEFRRRQLETEKLKLAEEMRQAEILAVQKLQEAENKARVEEERKAEESRKSAAFRKEADTKTYTSDTAVTLKKRSMMLPIVAGIIVILIAAIGFNFIPSKKEPLGREADKTAIPEDRISLNENKTKGVPQSASQQGNNRTIMEVGIFYEDEKGRLVPIREGITLHSKDNYAIYFKPNESSYLYVFQVDSKGNAFKLFPNKEEYKTINNPLKANRPYWIPSEGSFFFLDETVGKEEIFFFASSKPVQSLEEVKTSSRIIMEDTVKLM